MITDDRVALHESSSDISLQSRFQHPSGDHVESVSNMSSLAGKLFIRVAISNCENIEMYEIKYSLSWK